MNKRQIPSYSDDFHFFTTSIVTLATTYSMWKWVSYSWKIRQNKKLLKSITQSSIKTPGDTFKNGQKCIIKGTVNINKEGKYQTIAVPGQNKKKEEYVLHLRYLETMYSNENFQTNRKDYSINLEKIAASSEIKFHDSFYLSHQKNKILVKNYDQINYGPALQINKWLHKRRSLSLMERLHVLLLAYLRGVGTLVINDNKSTFLKGLEIGTREIQAGMKVGSSIMALGSIMVDTNGNLSFEPSIFFQERLSFVVNLKEFIGNMEDKRNFWAIIGLLGSLYVSRRIYRYHKKHNLKKIWREFFAKHD